MKTIYISVMERLKEEIPSLRWIDLDTGQLENAAGERPPVAFPAALIGVALPRCNTIYGQVQHCNATVTVRIAQNPPASRTAAAVPDAIRENALQRYALPERVHTALQGFGTQQFNELSRTRQKYERRTDGLLVCEIEYETEFSSVPNRK